MCRYGYIAACGRALAGIWTPGIFNLGNQDIYVEAWSFYYKNTSNGQACQQCKFFGLADFAFTKIQYNY
jgi:hypothetical protein